MKRLIAQSTLWTIALSMLCMPLTASAEPQPAQTPSVVSPQRGPVPGEGGRTKRRHKRRGQDQVCQTTSPSGQMSDGGNPRPGGWMDRKNGGKQLTPEERRARMERRRERLSQGQGAENGAGPGGRKISDEERQARREKRRQRMENGSGPGSAGGPKISDEERQARREKRRQRMENGSGPGPIGGPKISDEERQARREKLMRNRPGRVPGDSNQGSRPVENND